MPAKVTKSSTVKKVVKKTGTSKQTKSEPVEATPVQAELAQEQVVTPTETPATESTSTTSTDSTSVPSVNDEFTAVLAALNAVQKHVKELTAQVKGLQKHVAKEHRDLEKSSRGRKKKGVDGDKPKRAPSGFAKPTGLSSELCEFLGVPVDTQLARTDVTKQITTYVKEHELYNPENKKIILPDAKLGALLNVPSEEVLTYFNLQRYMKVHFQKASA